MPPAAEPPDPDADRPTAAPFLGALVIIVLVVIGIWVANLLDGDEASTDQDVGRAVAGQNDALQRGSYADYRAFTCAAQQGDEAGVLARQRDSVIANGQRYLDGVSDVRVDGDRATARATYHFDRDSDAKTVVDVAFVREDGAWKVCSPASS